MKPKVLCTGPSMATEAYSALDEVGITYVNAPPNAPAAQLSALASEHKVDAIIVRTGDVGAKVVEASPNLRLIVKHGIGLDNIDVASATALSVPVVNVPDAIAEAVAEMTAAMILALPKHLCRFNKLMHEGRWEKPYLATSVNGSTVGFIGMGRIARRIVRLIAAFGVAMVAYDKYIDESHFPTGVEKLDSLDALLATSDTVVILCPKTPETIGLISEKELELMKSSAFLINAARGGIVDESALVHALKSGQIEGAALDTFAEEPLGPQSPLIGVENVLLTPHVAGSSRTSLVRTGLECVRIVSHFLLGDELDTTNLINRDVTIA